MAPNSLFAILLRSPWWISAAIAAGLSLLAAALLPAGQRWLGAAAAFPLVVVAVMAARRQWQLPSAAKMAQMQHAVTAMGWPEFSAALEAAFVKAGHTVSRGAGEGVDFELARAGSRVFVSARRWKSASTGLEALRALHKAREAADVADALLIGLGQVTPNAQAFAKQHRIAIWQSAELAQALHGRLPAMRPDRSA